MGKKGTMRYKLLSKNNINECWKCSGLRSILILWKKDKISISRKISLKEEWTQFYIFNMTNEWLKLENKEYINNVIQYFERHNIFVSMIILQLHVITCLIFFFLPCMNKKKFVFSFTWKRIMWTSRIFFKS